MVDTFNFRFTLPTQRPEGWEIVILLAGGSRDVKVALGGPSLITTEFGKWYSDEVTSANMYSKDNHSGQNLEHMYPAEHYASQSIVLSPFEIRYHEDIHWNLDSDGIPRCLRVAQVEDRSPSGSGSRDPVFSGRSKGLPSQPGDTQDTRSGQQWIGTAIVPQFVYSDETGKQGGFYELGVREGDRHGCRVFPSSFHRVLFIVYCGLSQKFPRQ